MIFLNRNSDTYIPLQAKNSHGGAIDITSASITANFKESAIASTNSFTKWNTAAGGSDAQVQTVSGTNGIYLIKINQADVSALENRNYFMEVVIDISDDEYTQNDYCKIIGNREMRQTVRRSYGTTAQRPTLTTGDIGYMYYDTTLMTVIWWNGTAWE